MDYRKFLARRESLALPYFGGSRVDAPGRRLRLAREVEPGWWRFEIDGRVANAVEKCAPANLSRLPRPRGFWWNARLVQANAVAEPLWFLPAEEPALFTPVGARRWESGELLFEEAEFDTEAVLAVRHAFEEGQTLAGIKGIPAELRAAFSLALVDAAARRLHIPASPAEVRPRLLELADGGAPAAEGVLRELAAERERYRREQAQRERVLQEQLAHAAVEEERERRRTEAQIAARKRYASEEERLRALRETARERVEAALEAAGARLVAHRALGEDRVEVSWRFLNERFTSIVEGLTLQVLDAGICLGHPSQDRLLTLDSLPAVVREAVNTGRLVILRHDWDD